MSSSLFQIQEHIIPCQHIRQYPRATLDSQEDILHLAVKQYIPLSNPSPSPGDVTIIGGHANGFPKELYEPLWDDLLRRSESTGVRIRSIWIADVAHQGQSSVLNEMKLGNDPSWYDHPRDLLHMVNHFRSQMLRPIIGIGHSMGGQNLTNLSLLHPRLLETLILIDPVIALSNSRSGNVSPAQSSAIRRDLWPSRAAAAEAFKKSKFYQTWDRRVLDLWIKHGLRDLPTKLYPNPKSGSGGEKEVTLTTTKHQEVFTFFRPRFPLDSASADASDLSPTVRERILYPDIPESMRDGPLYRPEVAITFGNLPYVRPSVLYIFGELSPMSAPPHRKDKMERTGTGVGGSGGAKEGRVVEIVIKDTGHLIPMERVEETGKCCIDWLAREMRIWRQKEDFLEREREKLSETDRFTLSYGDMELLGAKPRPIKSKL